MRVTLVSKARQLERLFNVPDFRFIAPADLESNVDKFEPDEIVYIDRGSLSHKGWEEAVARLSAESRINWAVIDRDRMLSDPAALFHSGALDLVSGEALDGFVDEKRALAVIRFAELKAVGNRNAGSKSANHQDADQAHAKNHKPRQASFLDWDGLTEGKEYEFLMAYMGLCDADGLRTRLGDTRFSKLKASVTSVAESLASEHDGIVWINDGQSFLELFRPDSAPQVIASCLRVLANMVLVSYEQLRLDQETVYLCFSLYVASTPWQRPGNTGTIVADSINYIFHLGRKFTLPGAIDLVEGLALKLAPRLAERVAPVGAFEGKNISRFPGFAYLGQA